MTIEYFNKFIDDQSKGAKPLLVVIRGSHDYGTSTPTSDTDYAGIYIQTQNDILGFGYKEQINDDKSDIVFYEIKRFLELLYTNNPNILELLNTPKDCIIYKDPLFDLILDNKDIFITKKCKNSFGGYAKTQIQKASALNKKQNWEKEKITRKDVLDFVFVIENEKSIPWKKWNKNRKYDEKFCGVVNIPHANELYAVYFDDIANSIFSSSVDESIRNDNKKEFKENNKPMGLGYKGLVKVGTSLSIGNRDFIEVSDGLYQKVNYGISNQLRLSSVPKGETPICNIIYQKDAYSQHCREYREYQTWLENRNEQRYVDVKNHKQKLDGKNLLHTTRLLNMAREIALGKGIIVKRPNAEYLLSIRRGEVDLKTLIDNAEKEMKEIDILFDNSDLPDDIDLTFLNNLLIEIRNKFYKL